MNGVSKFEEYIIDKGFIPHVYDKKDGWIPFKGITISYSTYGPMYMCYKLEDLNIVYGLHEMGHPPTLISPRPKIKLTRINKDDIPTITNELYDSTIDILFQKESVETIYNSLFNKDIAFEYTIKEC